MISQTMYCIKYVAYTISVSRKNTSVYFTRVTGTFEDKIKYESMSNGCFFFCLISIRSVSLQYFECVNV